MTMAASLPFPDQLADEGTIDLQLVDRESLQVDKRAVARAEIIDADLDA